MKLLLVLIFCFSFYAQSDAMLDILKKNKNSSSDFSLEKHLKKTIGSLLPSSVQDIDQFDQAIEQKDYKSALILWNKNIQNTSFAKTSTGQALHAFLMFKNGFKVLALNKLLNETKINQINSVVYNLWKLEVSPKDSVWDYYIYKWQEDWSRLFNADIIFNTGSKAQISLRNDRKYIEYLLSLPTSKKIDKFEVRWWMALHFVEMNDMDSSTKTMIWLLDQTKNKKSKNTIYLTIARLLYDIGQEDAALNYYKKVNDASPAWFLAKEEQSWIHYHAGRYDKALESISAFQHQEVYNYLNSTIALNLSLVQLKNCRYPDLAKSMKYSYDYFSQKKDYLETASKNNYKKFNQDLIRYYLSDAMDSPFIPISFKNDRYLKSVLLLRNYMLTQKNPENNEFKNLKQEQIKLSNQLLQIAQPTIAKRIQTELMGIEKLFKWMSMIETEALYRIYAYHEEQNKEQSLQKTADSTRVIYPFEKDSVWLDESNSYKAYFSKVCPKNYYTL